MLHDNGYTLIAMLIFLFLASAASLVAINNLLLSNKMHLHQWQYLQTRQTIQGIATQLSHKIADENPDCVIPIMTSNNIKRKPLEWWQQQACCVKSYCYVAEDLGENVCASIGNNAVAHYFRLTILLTKENSFFQTIIVKPKIKLNDCDKTSHFVTMGVQFIREI